MTARLRPWLLASATAALLGLGSAPEAGARLPGLATFDALRAGRARDLVTAMDLVAAHELLSGADLADSALALERSRLAMFEGDYDGAALMLARGDLAGSADGAELGDIARGCARGMAATVEVRDDERGVVVRFQDDDDLALAPELAEVAAEVRKVLVRDLGVELPRPIRIDLVRDQFTLAAMTGLPDEAARTTGTVAVAKWGRVTMISPRATPHGYPWLDTLAHELTHLALARGTLDRAPLWLQEGVAKREETRWREPQPVGEPHSKVDDVVAITGLEKGLGRALDKLGPSIAMLPTAEEASIAYAEVASFIRFWAQETGEDALPRLVVKLRESLTGDADAAIKSVSGSDLAAWDKRWRAYLALVPRELAAELLPGARIPHRVEVVKRARLASLLHERAHDAAAVVEATRAQELFPTEPSLRAALAEALLGSGDRAGATRVVEKALDLRSSSGRWWSLHGLLHPEPEGEARSFHLGLALDPLGAEVACEEKAPPGLPEGPLHAALCEAARRAPR